LPWHEGTAELMGYEKHKVWK